MDSLWEDEGFSAVDDMRVTSFTYTETDKPQTALPPKEVTVLHT